MEKVEIKEWAGQASEYHECTVPGRRHWGANGAAGMVPVAWSGRTRYALLTLRSPRVDHGLTWSTLGGALLRDESPDDGAFRECREELTGLESGGHVVATLAAECPHGCGWTYTTFAVEFTTDDGSLPNVGIGPDAWETSTAAWFPIAVVSALPGLHPAFAHGWDTLADQL